MVVMAAVATILIATSDLAIKNAFADIQTTTPQANTCANDLLPMDVFCRHLDSHVEGEENSVSQSSSQSGGEDN